MGLQGKSEEGERKGIWRKGGGDERMYGIVLGEEAQLKAEKGRRRRSTG